MDGVWADLLSSDIQKGALIAPQLFYDPMDSSNLIINSNVRLQKMLTENLKPPPKNMLLEGMCLPIYIIYLTTDISTLYLPTHILTSHIHSNPLSRSNSP